MTMRTMTVAGVPARVARAGYTGEFSFEVNVPARHGERIWDALAAAGEPFGLTLIGSEASMVMRCEKGFVSAGFEGDGIVNPFDAGCGWAVDMDKGDFIGRRSLVRDRNVGGVRPNVVGLLPEDPSFVPPDGTPLVAAGAPARCAAGDRIRLPGLPQPERRTFHRPRGARRRPASARRAGRDCRNRSARPRAGDPPVLRRPGRRADEGLRRWAIEPR